MISSDTLEDNDEGTESRTELIALDEVQPPSERSNGNVNGDDDGNGNNDGNDDTDNGNNCIARNEVCQAFNVDTGTTTTTTTNLESNNGGTNDDSQNGKIKTVEGEGESNSNGGYMVDLENASGNGKSAFWWNVLGMKEVPHRGVDPLLDLRDETPSSSSILDDDGSG